MPIHPEQLSRYFDRLCVDLLKEWDNCVENGSLSDKALTFRRTRMEEIGAILHTLAEGQAVLTYKTKPSREPAPLIRLPWTGQDDG